MKKLLIISTILLNFAFTISAQSISRAVNIPLDESRKKIYDSLFLVDDWRIEWYKNVKKWYHTNNQEFDLGGDWLKKKLNIGDLMPDLELGLLNNHSYSKIRFSDFRGKIVILDFWTTSCSACIASFPKMEQLQRKFSDQIQIILVNTSETEEKIKKRMGSNISKIPNLPILAGARYLIPYFPTFGVPYHVWIDQKGVVRVLGSSYNTYEKKIQDLLSGKEIFSWENEATRPRFRSDLPYSKLVGRKSISQTYNSFFTSFNKDYAPGGTGGSFVVNWRDSLTGDTRNTFVNLSVQKLFTEAFKLQSKQLSTHKKCIFNPYAVALYNVKDSLRYTVDDKVKIDTAFNKSRFCYEQVYPKGVSKVQAGRMMAEDLNKYFGNLYGTFGRVEKRLLPGYVIVKFPGKNYKTLLSKNEDLKATQSKKRGGDFMNYEAISLTDIVDQILRTELYASKKILINESGLKGDDKIDIQLPANASIRDFKHALNAYGLDIIERNIEIELLVISDTKAK